jgi:O-antigen/teichoic acid export membrane protein
METEIKFPLGVAGDALTTSSASIISRVSRGLGALSLSAVVQILGQVAIVPVALYAWGKIRYGEWIVLTGMVTVLRLTDLGLQTFVVNRLCASFARGDRKQMQRDLTNALGVQIPLVVAVGLFLAAVVFLVPLERILDLETVAHTTFSVVALLLIVELLIGVPMGVIAGIYRATGRLARAAFVGAVQQFAILGSTVVLIAWKTGFVSLAGIRVAIALIVSAWVLYDLRHLYPWLRLSPRGGEWRDGARMIGPGIFFLLIPLADYLSTQFTLMIVQSSLDGGEVSRLATHRTVVNLAMMASGLLTTAVWPELTALHARGEHNQLRKTHRSLARMNMWLVGAVAFGMLPFVPLIYPSWTAGRLSIEPWTLAFLMTRMLLWGIWSASMSMLCAINKQKSVAGVLLAGAAVTTLFSLWLIPRIGISGAALAQLIGDLSISAWLIPLLASGETDDNFGSFVISTATALLKGLLIPIGIGFIGWRLIQSELIRLVVLVPGVFSLAVGLMWTQLAAYERSHLVGLIKSRFSNQLM